MGFFTVTSVYKCLKPALDADLIVTFPSVTKPLKTSQPKNQQVMKNPIWSPPMPEKPAQGTPAGTPALTASDIPELTLQSRCFLWTWNTYPEHRQMLFHVQNKARNRIEGAKFKAMGVVKGVSDMILIGPGRVVFVELKTGTGSQSSEQREFEQKVTERGHMYVVIRDEDAFRNLVAALWGPAQNGRP